MSIKKREFPSISNLTPSTTSQQNIGDLEKRVVELERKSHTPCSGGGGVKADLSTLPDLPPRKQTPIAQRLEALENKVEELIKLLS
jgi:hypothetical protein